MNHFTKSRFLKKPILRKGRFLKISVFEIGDFWNIDFCKPRFSKSWFLKLFVFEILGFLKSRFFKMLGNSERKKIWIKINIRKRLLINRFFLRFVRLFKTRFTPLSIYLRRLRKSVFYSDFRFGPQNWFFWPSCGQLMFYGPLFTRTFFVCLRVKKTYG